MFERMNNAREKITQITQKNKQKSNLWKIVGIFLRNNLFLKQTKVLQSFKKNITN